MADKGALIFILDRNYLLPFKVLMHTLHKKVIRPSNVDIVLLTDDPEVGEDYFVKNYVNRVISVSEEQISFLQRIDVSKISPSHRHPKYGAYWFLKFLIFDDYGYDFHIYMDADMLCASRRFHLRDICFGNSFAAAPTIGRKALSLKGKSEAGNLDEVRKKELLKTVLGIANRRHAISRSLNSGVMYIPKRLIGRAIVEGLVKEATQHAFRLEQDTVRQYVELRTSIPFVSLPVWYNFPELPVLAMGEAAFDAEIRKKTKILHFNLHPKPWDAGRQSGWVQEIWWRHHDLAQPWINEVSRNSWLFRVRRRLRRIFG
jgi:lipopolysaccharide biosynthesis glycosyltransferase